MSSRYWYRWLGRELQSIETICPNVFIVLDVTYDNKFKPIKAQAAVCQIILTSPLCLSLALVLLLGSSASLLSLLSRWARKSVLIWSRWLWFLWYSWLFSFSGSRSASTGGDWTYTLRFMNYGMNGLFPTVLQEDQLLNHFRNLGTREKILKVEIFKHRLSGLTGFLGIGMNSLW